MIHSITVIGGHGKDGAPEPVRRIELEMGDVVSIVGPTGSGKTTLINDLELFACNNTPTGRTVLINGETAPAEFRNDPAHNPIALITNLNAATKLRRAAAEAYAVRSAIPGPNPQF